MGVIQRFLNIAIKECRRADIRRLLLGACRSEVSIFYFKVNVDFPESPHHFWFTDGKEISQVVLERVVISQGPNGRKPLLIVQILVLFSRFDDRPENKVAKQFARAKRNSLII